MTDDTLRAALERTGWWPDLDPQDYEPLAIQLRAALAASATDERQHAEGWPDSCPTCRRAFGAASATDEGYDRGFTDGVIAARLAASATDEGPNLYHANVGLVARPAVPALDVERLDTAYREIYLETGWSETPMPEAMVRLIAKRYAALTEPS